MRDTTGQDTKRGIFLDTNINKSYWDWFITRYVKLGYNKGYDNLRKNKR